MVRQTLLIARREFVERGRSRVFIGVVIGTALLIVGGLFAIDRFGTPTPSTGVALAGDYPAGLAADIESAAAQFDVDMAIRVVPSAALARDAVTSGEVDAALVDGATILTVGPPPTTTEAVLRAGAAQAARRLVAERLGLSAADLAALSAPVQVAVVDIDPAGPADAESETRGAFAFLSVLVLFMALLTFGQYVASGVVEEKQNRVAEVVLAKTGTTSLLVGKVLGIGALGMIQLLALGAATVVGLRLYPPDLAAIDVDAIGATAVLWMLLWFVVGYLMYSFVYATLAATVSRQEDLQALAYVPLLLLMPPYLMVAADLGGSAGAWLAPSSFVPLWSPLLMPYRLVTGDAAPWEGLIAMIGSWALIVVLAWLGARVYRGSAMRVGARVPLREAWRAG